MIRSVNLALMEAENIRLRATRQASWTAQHPLAEFYGEWKHARTDPPESTDSWSCTVSLKGDRE